ncbi:MAG: ATP-dependent Clp protease proteolytic subunit, partial [Bacilli bacterium]
INSLRERKEAKEKEKESKAKSKETKENTKEENKVEEEKKELFNEIDIYGSIDSHSLQSMMRSLNSNMEDKKRSRIKLTIVSSGGSVDHLNSMIGLLKSWSKPIVVITNGPNASCAIDLINTGDIRLCYRGSRFMVHNTSFYSMGDDKQLAKDLKHALEEQNSWKKAFMDATGLTNKEFDKLIIGENWLNTTDALNLGTKGLIDGIILRHLEGHKVEVLMRGDVVKVIDLYNDDLDKVKEHVVVEETK